MIEIKMIEIELINGIVLRNDPKIGFNAGSIKTIEECLDEFGEYSLFYKGGRFKVRKEHVRAMRIAEDIPSEDKQFFVSY